MLQIKFSHDKAIEVMKELETLYQKLLNNLIKELLYFLGNYEKHEYQQPIRQDNLIGFRNGVRTNLDNLNYDIEELINEVLDQELSMFEEHLTEIYLEIFEDKDKLDQALENKWCGTNFRDVLLENTRQYIHKVKKELNAGLIRGDSKSQIKDTITKLTNSFTKKISTILTTETTYINNQALLDKGLSQGYTKVRINEILDKRTCSLCQSKDGEEIPIKDVKFGVNTPPFHTNCRGSIEFI